MLVRPRLIPLVLLAFTAGCTGVIRRTTTARTASETLLLSTAAERAIRTYDARFLKGKRVRIDADYLRSLDREYVIAALREQIAAAGGILVAKGKHAASPDVVVEVACATLGIEDPSYKVGIPPLPLTIPLDPLGNSYSILTPDLTFGFDPQYGWAKLVVWARDAKTGARLGRRALWGFAQTGWFQDVYPSALEALKKRLGGSKDAKKPSPPPKKGQNKPR